MSGYWIGSEKKSKPLTVKELRDFFNEIGDDYGDDYLSRDGTFDPWEWALSYIQVSGFREKDSVQPLTTSWMRNPYVYERIDCDSCGTKVVRRREK